MRSLGRRSLGEVRKPRRGRIRTCAVCAFVRFYEEPTLRAAHGESYQRYLQAVPRWVPRLRPWPGRPAWMTASVPHTDRGCPERLPPNAGFGPRRTRRSARGTLLTLTANLRRSYWVPLWNGARSWIAD